MVPLAIFVYLKKNNKLFVSKIKNLFYLNLETNQEKINPQPNISYQTTFWDTYPSRSNTVYIYRYLLPLARWHSFPNKIFFTSNNFRHNLENEYSILETKSKKKKSSTIRVQIGRIQTRFELKLYYLYLSRSNTMFIIAASLSSIGTRWFSLRDWQN